MPGSIVVPLDGSKSAENTLPWAATLSRLYSAPVEFVHVLDREGAADDAEARFGEYVAGLAGAAGIPTYHAQLLQGNPGEAIVGAETSSLFVVIASHGHGGFKAAFVGSVADKVLRNSTVPVVVVPASGEAVVPDQRTVLVALDGSEAAERGLEVGRDVAGRLGSTVTLIRSWTVPVPAAGGFEAYYLTGDLIESIEVGAKEYIAATALPGEAQVVTTGNPSIAIAEAAESLAPELVVVTTSGKGLAARIALGSTTERLAHSLHRPLLVVPTRD